jgi:flagellar biosynthesis/type III secretory pathway chaperone
MEATEHLAELIRRKHQILVQLRDVGRRQADLVSSGEITALLKLLAGKQHLIVGLQDLERELKPFFAQHPDSRVWRSAADRARCAQMANECNALLEEVVALEKRGAEKMDARKNEVAEQLQQAHAATHVRNAYQAQRRSIA